MAPTPTLEVPRLSGMLRSFTTGYGAGGFDIDKQTLIRNSLVKQRNKERNSLANNAAAVSITWSYFNEGVAATESKEAKETRRQFNALLKHMTKLLDEESSSEDIHAAASLIYASLSNADADLNKSKEALSEVFGPIDGSLFNELVDIVRVLRDWRNAHAPPIVDPVAATKSTTASKTDAPTTTTTTSTTDRLTIEYAHDVRFTFQPIPILLERGNQGSAIVGVQLAKGDPLRKIREQMAPTSSSSKRGSGSGHSGSSGNNVPGASHDNPYWWVDEISRREQVDPRWLARQCQLLLDSSTGDMAIDVSANELANNILGIFRKSNTTADLQERLIELLGIERIEFIQLLLERKLDILSIVVAINEIESAASGITARDTRSQGPGFGCQIVIRSEQEKRLEKMRRKEARKGKSGGGGGDGGGGGFEFDAVAFRRDAQYAASRMNEAHQYSETLMPMGSTSSNDLSQGLQLPPGSKRTQHRDYEEVRVPYSRPPEWREEERLVNVTEMEPWAQTAFHGMSKLNRIQSAIFHTAFRTNENMLICAPTGAGKTNCAMLTILQEVGKHFVSGVLRRDEFKIVYVAPMKALAQEMVENFGNRLRELRLVVREFTGDMQLTKKELMETQMIVTTPEKWDVTTRKNSDMALVQSVRLLIFDEVHLLHEERGPVIESLVARTLRQVESSQSMVRIVGLSATLPNYRDVAQFLRVGTAGLYYFPASYRPVPLEQCYIGVKETNAVKRQAVMNEVAYERAVAAVRRGKQVMIFVHSRKDTFKSAERLKSIAGEREELDLFAPFHNNNNNNNNKGGGSSGGSKFTKASGGGAGADAATLNREISKVKSHEVASLLPYGFATHHAGMLRGDRNAVERLFVMGAIRVLCCTATLAWGVNLPAHTVIIKGTQLYDSKHGKFVDLGMLDVMQIFGRAGRPQYDTSGEGIIITEHDSLNNYLRLMTNQLHIESQFISRLSDNLNAEVALGTVTSIAEAVTWLSYTYLFVRMQRNPLNYGITWRELEVDPDLGRYRRKLLEDAARNLDRCRMIRFEERSGVLASTDLGRTASNFYIDHETVQTFNEHLNEHIDEPGLLAVVCQAHEFENIMVREEELEELEELLRRACRILPVKGGVENKYGKVNILLQAYLAHVPVKAFALVSDTAYVVQNASRMLRGVFEIALKKQWCSVAKLALTLSKMVDRRLWLEQHPLAQFVPAFLRPEIIHKLDERRLGPEELFDMTPADIGAAIRHPHLGKEVLALVKRLPYLELEAKVQPITNTVLRVQVYITPAFDWDDRVHGTMEPFWLWVEDTENEVLYHSEYWVLYKKGMGETHEVCFTIPIFEPLPPQYYVRVISDRWLHAENETVMEFKHLLLPQQHAPHTELLDLQPLPLSVLGNPEHEKLFARSFTHFNPIQTQVFHTLRHTDENVLLGAPTGSGKTVVAELAMLRLFEREPDRKVIYIGPLKALVRERMRDWQRKFVEQLGVRMVELTGDVTPDIRALKQAQIVTTTPEKWDGISRSWQQRDYVKKAGLVIIDEIHLLGQDRGPILEVIVSRMRYIASRTERPIRIIGLSTALANANDLAAWLGIGRAGLFNFKAHYRPVPLEIHIQGFEGKHYCPRMATMNKPAFNAILQYSSCKPVLVFVSSRRQTRLTAVDLIAHCAASENPRRFVQMPEAELSDVLRRVRDANLKHTLSFGIGLHHAGLSDGDREVVERLFGANKIQVLVTTSTLAWGVNLPAHLVVIKGTEFYDGKNKRYVDMPITDVLQMIGRAGRPQFDKSGTAVILVHEPKKNFYKKFLHEPFPVESSLLESLHDHISAEVVAGTISCKQDAIDYLTWTYLYRRLLMNPSYYGLESAEPPVLAAFLSEKLDQVLADLQYAQCLEVVGDAIEPLTLGRIAAYYYLNFVTVQLFSTDIGDANTIESLMQVLCNTAEYDELPVRHNEDALNEQLAEALPIKFQASAYDDPHVKAHLLLQAHFGHTSLPISDYVSDTKSVLDQAIRILQAMVDVAADGGWLFTTLNTMHLMQMVVQATWHDVSTLLTLPHITNSILDILEPNGITCIPEIMQYPRDRLTVLLEKVLNKKQLLELFDAIDRIPSIDLAVQYPATAKADSEVEIKIDMRRVNKHHSKHIYAPFFPKSMDETWWVVLGDADSGELIALRRVVLNHSQSSATLSFITPDEEGDYSYWVYLMCGSYVGIDQQRPIKVSVGPAEASGDESGDEDDDEA